jgi:hypothetical protein
MKRPSFQFYPADWRNDAALRMCSLAARGLWWEMLCIMHTSEPYGHLVAAGRPIEPDELGRIVGEAGKDVRKWLAELDRHAIFSKTDAGVIYSRRMVRDDVERGKWRDRQDKSRHKTEIVTPNVTPQSRRSSTSTSSSSASEYTSSLRSDVAPLAPLVSEPIVSKPSKRKKQAPQIEYPDWWPQEKWANFQEMRRSVRAKLTPEAERLLILKLTAYRDEGHDILAIINQSIENSYKGLFPVKHNGNDNGKRSNPHENFALGAYLATDDAA